MNSPATVDNTHQLRLIETKKKELVDKDYKRSYEARNDATGQLLAQCDSYEKSVSSICEIIDHHGNQWEMQPNRKVMPTRWLFKAPDGVKVFEIRLPNFLWMMINPLARTYLHLKDIRAQRSYRFIDLESSFGDRIFRSPVMAWSIMEKGRVVAKITRLTREEEAPATKGFFAKLKQFFKGSDWALLTPGSEPLFDAPIFIGLMLIYEEVSNTPA